MKEARYGWVVVWTTFVCLALIFGVSYSFAAFFTSFASEFDAQRADVSWILVCRVLSISCWVRWAVSWRTGTGRVGCVRWAWC